ncbi:MAG: MFS transporter [Renibacterium sp.]|nr:MFS transporter [Renibacterium sp.]
MASTTTRPKPQQKAPHPGLVLALMCACTILVIGFVASINLAAPLISRSQLQPSASNLLWIVDIYVVIFASFVLPSGAAGDRFGRKGVLTTGLIVFALGAALCALAPDVLLMLLGRTVTGFGAALVLPNCVGMIVNVTPAEHRNRALGIWAATTGFGGVIGNLGGGALLSTGSWQSLFIAAAAIAALLAVCMGIAAPRTVRHQRNLDPLGTLLFVLAVLALLIGIIEGPEQGWASFTVLFAFCLGAGLIGVWVLVELRVRHPMLDPRLFRNPLLSSACFGMLIMFFGNFGLFYVNASVLQYSRGYSVLQAGLGILPTTIPVLLSPLYARKTRNRLGVPLTLGAAFLLTSLGLFGISQAAQQPYPVYALWLLVIGTGLALALPSLTTEIAAALPAEQAGIAGGLQSATRELGSAVGVAVVGTVLTVSFTQGLPVGLQTSHTVAQALLQAPEQHAAIIAAFTTGADTALLAASIITFLAGGVVVAGAFRARRFSRVPG